MTKPVKSQKRARKLTDEKRAAIDRKVVSFTPGPRPDDVRELGCREPTWAMELPENGGIVCG